MIIKISRCQYNILARFHVLNLSVTDQQQNVTEDLYYEFICKYCNMISAHLKRSLPSFRYTDRETYANTQC